MPYCTYIDGDCDASLNATKCASVSTVWCRTQRDKNKEKADERAEVAGDCKK